MLNRLLAKLLCALALCLISSGFTATTASAQTPEKVRAIFLYNFAKNVEWPEGVFASARSPVVIGIVGSYDLAEELERFSRGKDANGRDISVERIDGVDKAAECQIIYVGNNDRVQEFIDGLEGKPVLTVGEEDDFTKKGGMIKLFSQGSKVGCYVNVTASTSAGLVLSSKLVASKN